MSELVHWERKKNEAIVELDQRNRNLQAKLADKESNDTLASQAEKMEQSILDAIYDACQHEATLGKPKKDDWNPKNQEMEGSSVWEWQKNKALLQLDKQNQELRCLLKQTDVERLKGEGERALVEEGFKRGKEYMRLHVRVRALQDATVKQTKRLSRMRRLNAAMCRWHQFCKRSQKRKVLEKARSVWDRHVLEKSFAALSDKHLKAITTRKLNALAESHRIRASMLHCFRKWMLRIHLRKHTIERSTIMKVLHRFRLLRRAFVAWEEFSDVIEERNIVKHRADKFLKLHRLQKSLQAWKNTVNDSQKNNLEAETFCQQRILERTISTWRTITYESGVESEQSKRSDEHAKQRILQRAFKAWLNLMKFNQLIERRYHKLVDSRKRKMLLFIFHGWRQFTKNKKEVRIWRGVSSIRQKLYLRHAVFRGWRDRVKLKQMILRTRSMKVKGAVFQSWSFLTRQHKACAQHVHNMKMRTCQRHVKDAFNLWLGVVERSRKEVFIRNAKLLEAQLQLSQVDLQGAGDTNGELAKLVKSLEKEKLIMAEKFDAISARTPVWSSGFLDAELRWKIHESPSKEGGPSARAGHAATGIQLNTSGKTACVSHIVIVGGYNGTSILNDVHVFHTVGEFWTIPKVVLKLGSSFPPPVRNHTACTHGNSIILFGGFDGSRDTAELSVLTFSIDGEEMLCEWSQPERKIGIIPGPMSQHSSCMTEDGEKMIVFGGYRTSCGHHNELWTLEMKWMIWSCPDCYGEPPSSRRGHAAVILAKKMYVFGGYDGSSNLGDLHTLDLNTMQWNCLKGEGELPSPRRQHSMGVVGRHLLVFGGYDGMTYLDDVHSFDSQKCVWKKWAVMKISSDEDVYGRSMHSMVVDGHRAVIYGGVHAHGALEKIVYLENAAAIDGIEVQLQLDDERKKSELLEEKLSKCEAMLNHKNRELAHMYDKVSEVQSALKVEARERKMAISQQKILIQKLKKVRTKSSLW